MNAQAPKPGASHELTVQPEPTQKDLAVAFKSQLTHNENEFKAALPAHIPVERFMRIVTTAVVNNPDLLKADRRSLFESATKAAQDGLLPDGRDGALVIYNTKVKEGGKEFWVKKVQWMPMIAGVLKKVRNSGELMSISAYVAYENDEFTYELGDDEKIIHRPALENRGNPRLAYAIAKTKDGGIYREVMTMQQIEKVRNVSRAKDKGPWVDWFDEMCRKSVLRRLSKRLPMSSDLDDLIRRDDALYDLDGARAAQRANLVSASTLTGRLDMLAGKAEPAHDAETGEIIEHSETDTAEGHGAAASQAAAATASAPSAPQEAAAADLSEGVDPSAPIAGEPAGPTGDAAMTSQQHWFDAGAKARAKGASRKAIPGELRGKGRESDADAWLRGFDEGAPSPSDR